MRMAGDGRLVERAAAPLTAPGVVRLDGTAASGRRRRLYRRLTLRRADGDVYLNRWGFGHDRLGGVLVHRMDAPDPGLDLHDHPWTFVSVVLWGGYRELRADTRVASELARRHAGRPAEVAAGELVERRPGSIRRFRLDECHTIIELRRRRCWTLVIKGPRRRRWGFYLPDGWVDEVTYDETVRPQRRDLWSDQNAAGRPW